MLARALGNVLLALAALGLSTPLAASGSADLPGVLVSRQLLEQRSLAVGEVIRLAANEKGEGAREFRIAGVYEPLPDPMRLGSTHFEARLHLPDLLALGGEADTVRAIQVRLAAPGDEAEFRRELQLRSPWLAALSSVNEESVRLFQVLERFHLAISLVTVLGSTAFLLALMVMRADERRELAGILRLVGFSRRRILLQVLIEGIAIAGVGGLLGVAFAGATQSLVNRFFQAHYDTALVFVRVTPRIALRSVATAIPLGVVAGLVASWALLRRDVVDLLRR